MKKSLYIFLAFFVFNTQMIAQENSKEEFKPSGKVWGYAFGDYFMKLHADSLNRGKTQYANKPENTNTFEFRRIYLGYDYNISEKFSSEFLISHEGTTLSDNLTRTVLVKAANVKWKNILPNTDIIFGQSATPAFSGTIEKFWGYRSIEKTILDMRGVSGSNDLGIALKSKFISNDKTEVGLHVMIGNGTAQKIETDVFKKIYGGLYALVLDKKVLVEVFSDYNRVQLSPYHKSKMSMKMAVAYKSDKISAGMEIFNQSQENSVIFADSSTATKVDTANLVSFGASFFVRGQIVKEKLGYFARYDMFNPNTKFDKEKVYFAGAEPNTESFITLGLDYTPVTNVHIMPNVWYNAYNNRTKDVKGFTKTDNDLVARLTVWYIFK